MVRQLRQEYGQAGVKTCPLTFFQPFAAVAYTSAQLDTIKALALSFQAGLSALVEGTQGNLFSETPTIDNKGDLYVQVVNLSNSKLTADRRTLLASISQKRVHALVQDMEGQWWLYGQHRGLRLRYTISSENGISISLNGVEREPARLVSADLIPGFLSFLN